MTFEQIIKDIDSLPPLSNAAHIVQSLYAGGVEHINISKLVRVIESDAMLSVNILKMINSPYYGMTKQISSISQAVSLLGVQEIYMLVIHYAISQKLKADPSIYGFTNAQFNDVCQLQGRLMLKWCSKINVKDAQFLTPLALMMESGKLILAKEVIKSDYCGEFRKSFNECEDIQKYEKGLIGKTSYALTAMLFSHWNLESKYVEILKLLDATQDELKEKKTDEKIIAYIQKIKVVRESINVKEILTNNAIKKSMKLVHQLGEDTNHFKEVALELRKSYLK
ncbi:HDOD domain-containing protein [Sulfurimonas sp.]|uniref:HDOD domain-containing protein n=1 Tax=Sulfurimonas sp. TaxID=2022749 RepID=UPI002AB1592D|nr:HDOD domain-containing protein [Sulfurimonas sp.]